MAVRYPRHSAKVTRTRRWQALRLEVKRRDDWKCVECGSHYRLQVDHKQPVRTHPELSFEIDNLQTLCVSCHTRKTRIECGHPPTPDSRLKWRQAVSALSGEARNQRAK